MRTTLTVCLAALAIAGPAVAGSFTDVPKDHWAADSVEKLAGAGVVRGYPDATFKGDRPVTRHELAVALERMIEVIRESRKPLASETAKPAAPETHWGEWSMQFLKKGRFLPKGSLLLRDGGGTVTFKQLGDALASVSTRLIELDVPAAEKQE